VHYPDAGGAVMGGSDEGGEKRELPSDLKDYLRRLELATNAGSIGATIMGDTRERWWRNIALIELHSHYKSCLK
jgi:hypothetical protein